MWDCTNCHYARRRCQPQHRVAREGIEPPSSPRKGVALPLDEQAIGGGVLEAPTESNGHTAWEQLQLLRCRPRGIRTHDPPLKSGVHQPLCFETLTTSRVGSHVFAFLISARFAWAITLARQSFAVSYYSDVFHLSRFLLMVFITTQHA